MLKKVSTISWKGAKEIDRESTQTSCSAEATSKLPSYQNSFFTCGPRKPSCFMHNLSNLCILQILLCMIQDVEDGGFKLFDKFESQYSAFRGNIKFSALERLRDQHNIDPNSWLCCSLGESYTSPKPYEKHTLTVHEQTAWVDAGRLFMWNKMTYRTCTIQIFLCFVPTSSDASCRPRSD